jgi:hypothetical protein
MIVIDFLHFHQQVRVHVIKMSWEGGRRALTGVHGSKFITLSIMGKLERHGHSFAEYIS